MMPSSRNFIVSKFRQVFKRNWKLIYGVLSVKNELDGNINNLLFTSVYVVASKGESEPERSDMRSKVDEDRKHEYPFFAWLYIKIYVWKQWHLYTR